VGHNIIDDVYTHQKDNLQIRNFPNHPMAVEKTKEAQIILRCEKY
jgi:hypothetical protein